MREDTGKSGQERVKDERAVGSRKEGARLKPNQITLFLVLDI